MSDVERWQAALAAEHASVFGHGRLGAVLPPPERALAADGEQAHRTRRDDLTTLLIGRGRLPVPAEPAYALPFPVTDPASARRLALLLEERTAATWRAVLPVTTGADRRSALEALTDCALRAARWRPLATPGADPTVPFPGG